MPPTSSHRAFTLIELLLVVGIIAILAAIALPNFLEAQTRAKVSRVMGDLRTIATALEAYCADNDGYPAGNYARYSVLPNELTTPVSYLYSSYLIDPFAEQKYHSFYGDLEKYYTYNKIVTLEEAIQNSADGRVPPDEAVDHSEYNFHAFDKYGKWKLLSHGPDGIYADPNRFTDYPLFGADILYDPTNGSASWGNILRTQLFPDGRIAYMP